METLVPEEITVQLPEEATASPPQETPPRPLKRPLNWRLIFLLSLFGLVMGIATVYWIPAGVELVIWFTIFDICAYLIVKRAQWKFFLHGFLLGLIDGVWITAIQILLVKPYLANHPEEAAMISTMPLADSPRLVMLITGVIVALTTAVTLGIFSSVASKFVKKPSDMIKMV